MHEVIPQRLWIGNTGDLDKPAALDLAGIRAVVQVALAEPMPSLSRDLLIAHFPIMDGADNSKGMVTAAVELVASLIRSGTPTLVCCSGGMSRSPSIVAGALAIARGLDPDEALRSVITDHPHDVSPALSECVRATASRAVRHKPSIG